MFMLNSSASDFPAGHNWWEYLDMKFPTTLKCIRLVYSGLFLITLSLPTLQKGPGYHLDLFIVGCLIFLHSAMGLPWVVGATVVSISHVQSLYLYSPCTAPGERPKFLGVR